MKYLIIETKNTYVRLPRVTKEIENLILRLEAEKETLEDEYE